MNLKTPVKEAGGVFKRYSLRLEKLGIKTFEDFLYHFPFRYENYSLISAIKDIQEGETVTIRGVLTDIRNEPTKRWKKIQKAVVSDQTGSLDVVWFNQPFILNILKKNEKVSLSGKVKTYLRKHVLESPAYEVLNENGTTIHTGRLVPVYKETYGISSKWLRSQIYKIIQNYTKDLKDYLPDKVLKENNLLDLKTSIEQIHFPDSLESAERARERLSFDELFLLQLSAIKRRSEWSKGLTGHPFKISKYRSQIEKFWDKLPFTLTSAQKKAVSEIFKDLCAKKPMNRLLEGDVGSGKTVVAGIAMYLSFLNGFQSVFMAPTEILADQHFQTISNLLSTMGVKIGFATAAQKQNTNNFDILIGTHAVLSDKINYEKLGLVVIDEQQRFGVEQRAIIRKRGVNPHFLTMTATPIPRTVALTLYGELDLSYLDEMPKGRKQVKTWLVPPRKREEAYNWIKNQIRKEKSQVFIICPFIEESESFKTVKAAIAEYERLKTRVFTDLKIELLHGKLKTKEKNKILNNFKMGKINILVSTPVVEVGIDVPNATIILIEAAERFGLSQLHQMRGRVGRGEKQSYCFLFTESISEKTLRRLKAMEKISFGAELAELDLKLRGPGELYGTAQHGIPHLKIASFSNLSLIEKTRMQANKIFPELKHYPSLANKIKERNAKQVSPD